MKQLNHTLFPGSCFLSDSDDSIEFFSDFTVDEFLMDKSSQIMIIRFPEGEVKPQFFE
jgi:hypothetical protein